MTWLWKLAFCTLFQSIVGLPKPDGQEEMESIDYIFHIGAKPRQVQTLQQIVFRDDKTLEVPVNAREDQALPYVRPARNDVTAEDRSAQLVKPKEFQGSESDSRILSGNRSPALVPNDLAPVTSNVPLRIRIGNTTNLFGSPGESVNVEFLITNYGPASTIFFSAEESQATDPDQVNFPVEQFLMSLSSSRASLSSNSNYTCFMNLVVPPHAAAGTRKTISFVAQASNAGGAPLSITRRIYFTVGGSNIKNTDSIAPECRVLSNDRAGQCQDQLSNPAQPEACRQVRWTSRFQIEDSQSGLKSIDERPLIVGVSQDAYFSHQNYILGTKLPVEYFFSASCCMETFALKLADVAGNQGQCYVGKLPNDPEANVDVQGASSTGIIIAIVVSAIILILVVIGAIAVIFVMKKKRKAELAEMRETPQAR